MTTTDDYLNSQLAAGELTEDELVEKIEQEMIENSLSELERLRRDNPSLADAWDQIKTIRGLTETQQENYDKMPAWERRYFELLEGVETKNKALRDAWDKYYMMKGLIEQK